MSEEQGVSHTRVYFQAEKSAARSSALSRAISKNISMMNSSPHGASLNAESGGESDHSGDSRNEDVAASALSPIPFEGEESSERPINFNVGMSPQNPSSPQAGGEPTLPTVSPPTMSYIRPAAVTSVSRRPSFGLGFLSSLSNTIRGSGHLRAPSPSDEALQNATLQSHQFMSNSPTLANLNIHSVPEPSIESTLAGNVSGRTRNTATTVPLVDSSLSERETTTVDVSDVTFVTETEQTTFSGCRTVQESNGRDNDGTYSLRLTPVIDHSSSHNGLYFAPIIRRVDSTNPISVGRYTEKHKSAAHAPQGSSSRVVFKSKVVSRTHAMFQCNEEGTWFLKDCKSSSGTFLNNIRLSQASQESTLWPLMDGDVVQLGLDYRGGTEEVYRCVKMRCEFNRSWQRKVNKFNLDIHKKMKNLSVEAVTQDGEEFSECAICLLKLEPCQALFISPCSHSWHYKCIRPIIIKRYPQFYCPNCRSVCDLETDIEDEE